MNKAEVVNLSSACQFRLNKLHSIAREDHNVHHHKEHLWARLFSKTYVELTEYQAVSTPPPSLPNTHTHKVWEGGIGDLENKNPWLWTL